MAWGSSVGNIRGPKGDTGDTGPTGRGISSAEIRSSDGYLVLHFTDGSQTAVGDVTGEDGAGIQIAGTVATYSALPTTLGPSDAGKAYLVDADGLLYIWDGSQFPASGSGVEFRGDDGRGITNAAVDGSGHLILTYSDSTTQDVGLVKGADGSNGSQGAQGAPGARGSIWFTGTGSPAGKTFTPSPQANDQYLDVSTGDVYTFV